MLRTFPRGPIQETKHLKYFLTGFLVRYLNSIERINITELMTDWLAKETGHIINNRFTEIEELTR